MTLPQSLANFLMVAAAPNTGRLVSNQPLQDVILSACVNGSNF